MKKKLMAMLVIASFVTMMLMVIPAPSATSAVAITVNTPQTYPGTKMTYSITGVDKGTSYIIQTDNSADTHNVTFSAYSENVKIDTSYDEDADLTFNATLATAATPGTVLAWVLVGQRSVSSDLPVGFFLALIVPFLFIGIVLAIATGLITIPGTGGGKSKSRGRRR